MLAISMLGSHIDRAHTVTVVLWYVWYTSDEGFVATRHSERLDDCLGDRLALRGCSEIL